MILKAYVILDHAAEAFTPPMFQPTENMMLRSFTESVNNPEHNFNKYPESYTLFYIGEYDDNTGTMEVEITPKKRYNAYELLNKETVSNETEKSLKSIGNGESVRSST